MGIILKDAIEINGGINVANMYLNIKNTEIIKTRDMNEETGEMEDQKYIVHSTINRYASKEMRDKNLPFDEVNVSYDIVTLPSNMTEIYSKTYDILKTMSSTWEDVIN